MTSEIKPRTVYQLVRTDKPDNWTDIYVGSTSLPLNRRLSKHRTAAGIENSRLYTRMLEVGIYKWKIVPLLTYPCDQKTIREFEKTWIDVLNSDLNTNSPLDENSNVNNIEVIKKHYRDSIESKKYYCDVCDKSFGKIFNLKRHFNSLKHSYAYMNSVD